MGHSTWEPIGRTTAKLSPRIRLMNGSTGSRILPACRAGRIYTGSGSPPKPRVSGQFITAGRMTHQSNCPTVYIRPHSRPRSPDMASYRKRSPAVWSNMADGPWYRARGRITKRWIADPLKVGWGSARNVFSRPYMGWGVYLGAWRLVRWYVCSFLRLNIL